MNGVPFFPAEASTLSTHVDLLLAYWFCIAVFFTLLIAGLITYFAIRYHHRNEDANRARPPTVNLPIEVLWTAIPLGITLSLFIWGARLFVREHQPPSDALEVYVVGKQWMWRIQHASGQQEINELHVPVGQPIKLLMTSQDVIHSFFVPAFRIKQDVLPGRYTTEWFTATRPGRYHLFCAQYCGTSHADMGGWVIAMRPTDYEQWLTGQSVPATMPTPLSESTPGASAPSAVGATSAPTSPVSMAAQGQQLMEKFACLTCHMMTGQGAAPTFRGLYGKRVHFADGTSTTADETYIRNCILKPNAHPLKGYSPIMPTFTGQLSESDIQDIIAYIKSLKG